MTTTSPEQKLIDTFELGEDCAAAASAHARADDAHTEIETLRQEVEILTGQLRETRDQMIRLLYARKAEPVRPDTRHDVEARLGQLATEPGA
jgi:hypothetical protein